MADASGEIYLEDEYTLPITVVLRSLEVKTTSNCTARQHKVELLILNSDSEEIISLDNEIINDCTDYRLPIDELRIKSGSYNAKFMICGFSPNENVEGSGKLRFGLGLNIAEIDGIQEISD
ncbi:MAG: hypothetical protein F6K19_41880 [Cyanothece sp. SIO1E1]|nr:hypothetical protein [Cyanothece sp. SIO1E1]